MKKMHNIKELVKKLCSNGVEYKPLWSITIWDKKFNGVEKKKQSKIISYYYYLASEFEKIEQEKGDILYISTGITDKDRYTTSELADGHISEGEIVCIPWGGTPNVKYYKGRFVTGDNRIATSINTNILSNKFLYYWMQSKIALISSFYRGSGIKHPDMKKILELRVPVPPIEVQNEIVRILDNFTELEAELEAELEEELEARKKQYEYYYTQIIKKYSKEREVKMDDIFPYIRNGFVGTVTPYFTSRENGIRYIEGKNIHNGNISDNEMLYVTEEFHKKHIKNELKENDIVMVQSGHVGESAVVGKKYKGANCHALIIMSNGGQCNSKYVKYYLNSSEGKKRLAKITTGGTVKHILASAMKKFKIPLPTFEEQEEIVYILDRFDKLCNDISEGLPAEIEARRKQYEYYRDKLLNFKELKVEK